MFTILEKMNKRKEMSYLFDVFELYLLYIDGKFDFKNGRVIVCVCGCLSRVCVCSICMCYAGLNNKPN